MSSINTNSALEIDLFQEIVQLRHNPMQYIINIEKEINHTINEGEDQIEFHFQQGKIIFSYKHYLKLRKMIENHKDLNNLSLHPHLNTISNRINTEDIIKQSNFIDYFNLFTKSFGEIAGKVSVLVDEGNCFNPKMLILYNLINKEGCLLYKEYRLCGISCNNAITIIILVENYIQLPISKDSLLNIPAKYIDVINEVDEVIEYKSLDDQLF